MEISDPRNTTTKGEEGCELLQGMALDVASSELPTRNQESLDEDSSRERSPVSVDGRRENEFYRYYWPFKASVANRNRDPIGSVLHSSDDRALTAFAQLGALRLGVRRCTISFFDRKTQYVLAEATKTLSLQNDEPEDPRDALLWGVSEFPLDAGLCQHTMRKPTEYLELEDGNRIDVTIQYFPDMSQDPRFKDLPFVCGDAHTRFYAAVPIHSPSGVTLGSYCIMDDEPRPSLEPNEVAFLKDMATTVMVHLEMVRAREEIRRNALFIHGLGSFVEGESSILKGRRVVGKTSSSNLAGGKWYEKQYAMQRISAPQYDTTPMEKPGEVPVLSSDVTSPTTNEVGDAIINSLDGEGIVADMPKESQPQYPISQERNSSERRSQDAEIRDTFARAANIIQECLDVDGVVLYDASVGTFAGLIETDSDTDHTRSSAHNSNAPRSLTEIDSNSDENVEYSQAKLNQAGSTKPCALLGYATPTRSTLRQQDPPKSITRMSEKLLRRLLRRYPLGGVFNLSPAGASPPRNADEDQTRSEFNTQDRKRKYKSLHRGETKIIREIFPGVRSMMLVPFYDISRKCNYAGAVIWSTDAQRIFSHEQALTYLAAFADSVMAEVARIGAKAAEQIKSDFISSISHELRSPLHGILGGVECLQDANDRATQKEILQSVETCGKTLLDTIDHLLDFAKINDFSESSASNHRARTRVRKRIANGKDAASDSAHDTRRQSIGREAHGLESDVNIAKLTTEVIKTVQAGHSYTHTRGKGSDSPEFGRSMNVGRETTMHAPTASGEERREVPVIIDIEQGSGSDWSYRTQPGAWRRIVMNLFGNALKYTSQGHIRVRLHASHSAQSEQYDDILLQVSDTGCGMSKEFQETQLFTPFAQENHLAPGTGLGLSIIKQILKDMGGNITVQSERGKGTVFEVKLRLERSQANRPPPEVDSALAAFKLDDAVVTPDITTSEFNLPSSMAAPVTEPSAKSNTRPLLPREMPAVNELGSPTPTSTSTGASTPQPLPDGRKRVLLVEDNDINLRLLIMYMKKQGHYYETARNGLEALEAFRAAAASMNPQPLKHEVPTDTPPSNADGAPPQPFAVFDYILMDISMPVMDGLESSRRIRAHERQLQTAAVTMSPSERPSEQASSYTPATIIALTGLASTQTRQEAYSSGVNHFMPKPVKLAELTRVMNTEGSRL